MLRLAVAAAACAAAFGVAPLAWALVDLGADPGAVAVLCGPMPLVIAGGGAAVRCGNCGKPGEAERC